MESRSENRPSFVKKVEMLESRSNVHDRKLDALANQVSSIQELIKNMASSSSGGPRQVQVSPKRVNPVKTLKEIAGRLLKNGNNHSPNTEDSSGGRERSNTTSPLKKMPNLRPRLQNGSVKAQEAGSKASETSTSSGHPSRSTKSSLRLRSVKFAIKVHEGARMRTRAQPPTPRITTTDNTDQPIVKLKQVTAEEILKNTRKTQQRRSCGFTIPRRRMKSALRLNAARKAGGMSTGSNSPRRSTRVSHPPTTLQYFGDMRSPLAADGLSTDNSDAYEPEQKRGRMTRAATKQFNKR